MKKIQIFAMTPNPTLDLSGHVTDIFPNEKNIVSNVRTDPGGNSINAARIAKRLGASPVNMGFLGGASGKQLKVLLRDEGLLTQFIDITASTRTNVTVTNDKNHQQTRLSFPGPDIRSSELRNLFSSVKKLKSPGIFLLGGSAPGNCPTSFYITLILLAQKNGLGVMLDVPAAELKHILKSKISKLLCIKPNLGEFEVLSGKKFRSDAEIAVAARRFLKKSSLICVSLGKRGVLFAWNNQVWILKPPRVKSRGSVGAGDSMVGAIVAKLSERGFVSPMLCDHAGSKEILDVIRWGVAAGSATVMTEGTSLGDARLIQNLYKRVRCIRL